MCLSYGSCKWCITNHPQCLLKRDSCTCQSLNRQRTMAVKWDEYLSDGTGNPCQMQIISFCVYTIMSAT